MSWIRIHFQDEFRLQIKTKWIVRTIFDKNRQFVELQETKFN